MLEREFSKAFKHYLEQHDCLVYKNPAGLMRGNRGMSYSVASGYPDFVVYNNGTATLVELKTDKKTSKLRASQVHRFKELNKVGMTVFVVRPQDMDLFKPQFEASNNDFHYTAFECFRDWEHDAKEFGTDEPKRTR